MVGGANLQVQDAQHDSTNSNPANRTTTSIVGQAQFAALVTTQELDEQKRKREEQQQRLNSKSFAGTNFALEELLAHNDMADVEYEDADFQDKMRKKRQMTKKKKKSDMPMISSRTVFQEDDEEAQEQLVNQQNPLKRQELKHDFQVQKASLFDQGEQRSKNDKQNLVVREQKQVSMVASNELDRQLTARTPQMSEDFFVIDNNQSQASKINMTENDYIFGLKSAQIMEEYNVLKTNRHKLEQKRVLILDDGHIYHRKPQFDTKTGEVLPVQNYVGQTATIDEANSAQKGKKKSVGFLRARVNNFFAKSSDKKDKKNVRLV